MARKSKPIRIDANTKQEYEKLVKQAKAKLKNINRKVGLDLTDQIDLPSIESFKTRHAFNEWKEKTASFTNPHNQKFQFVKNPYGVVASKSELFHIEKDTKTTQRRADELNKKAKEKPFISGGKEQKGGQQQQMLQMANQNAPAISRPPDFRFEKIRDSKQLQKRKENAKKKSKRDYFDKRTKKMQESFIQTLEFAFNSDADKLIESIRKIPADDFYEIYLIYDEFNFTYYPSPQSEFNEDMIDEGQMFSQLREMESAIEKYEAGKVNMDLKGI